MGLQAHMGNKLYSVERDIAHNFGWMVKEVLRRMNNRPWEAVEKYLRDQNVTDEEVAKAVDVFANFVMSVKNDNVGMHDAMTAAGWWECTPLAQVALCAYLGNIMVGVYYVGVKEAMLAGNNPIDQYPDLRAAAADTAKFYRRRPWYKLIVWAIRDLIPFGKKKRA